MPTIAETLAIAIEDHQAGRLQIAEALYGQILQSDPRHAEAMHLLGVLALQGGHCGRAVELIERAIELDGRRPIFYSNLGEAYRRQRRDAEAIASYQRALALNPDFAGAYYNLGNALKAQKRLGEAIDAYRQAIARKPDYADAHNNLGNALKDQGDIAEAVASYRRAIEHRPDSAESHNNLGNALKDLGRVNEAIDSLNCALRLCPDHVEAQCNLGTAMMEIGRHAEAIACYQKALKLKPDFAPAHFNLGFALADQGRLGDAVQEYEQALTHNPRYAEALNNLGVAFRDQGLVDEALTAFRKAIEVEPRHITAHSNLVFTQQYQPGVTPAELLHAHEDFGCRHAEPFRGAWKDQATNRDPRRRLRLGFVSPDFRRHPVAYFFVGVFENLDPEQCETFCYYNGKTFDEFTRRFQARATAWRDIRGHGDERVAEQIRSDGIDILFDLAGHTAHNRLLVFARKPAPVQITWIGYEGTTGLAAMDYLLADRHVVPAGTEHLYREKILRTPAGYVCYGPPSNAPPAGVLPSLKKRYVTFASFNNLAKISPHVVTVWSKILHRVPGSRLLLRYKGLGDDTVRRRYINLFAGSGISANRVDLLPPTSYPEYLATFQEVDIALDPFPFSGSTTTCEALWMGVPVITLPGETFASRHSLSHLSTIGLTETVAGNLEEYVELAAALARDTSRLAALRASLRERMAASPLCDGRRFAENLLGVLRAVWTSQDRTQPAGSPAAAAS